MKSIRFFSIPFSCFFLAAAAFSPGARADTPLTTEPVAAGFDRPLYVTAPPGDRHRLFVVEQGGLIRIIKDGAVLGAPFIDLSSKVSGTGNERGLLGLAFHPGYGSNGFFYVDYTRALDHATVVERYSVSGADPDTADPASGVTVLGPITQPFGNHNGGCIQFGPDGKLYVGMGDGGSGGDPNCFAQKGNTLLGKMLRINDDGTIPADNPFVGDAGVLDEIWAFGLRNPWRFSFDRKTGGLYIADVGQNQWEEVDFQPASSTGGENYGWKVMEGAHCFGTSGCDPDVPPCFDPRLTLPIFEYEHLMGRCSITGGYVYRGCAVPDLRGSYFFADYCSGDIVSIRYDGTKITEFKTRTFELMPGGGSAIDRITSFGQDGDGELYIVDQGFSSTTGEIYKIVPDAPPVYEDLGFAKAGTGGIEPRLDACGFTGTGQTGLLKLRDGAPSRPAFLVLSLFSNPAPLFGGTLLPGLPAWKILSFTTDTEGRILLPFQGGGGPLDLFCQYLIDDPGASQGAAFSNAVKVIFQP